jgi:pyridoxine/pyridoxamine 5'-phosphate oxidase
MTKAQLVEFMRRYRYAVQASIAPDGSPQAALVGIAVTDDAQLVFDTLSTSRKCQNLRQHPRCAFVIGCEDPATVQYEGTADQPTGHERERLQQLYFASFPDGRERASLPDITYFRVRPVWIRHSDFSGAAPQIIHFTGADLAG